MDNKIVYKVFISYAWTNPEHEKWVDDLATRLENQGLDVKYDKWDLKVGQDKYAFMESMVHDDSINKVLLICDKGYKDKADNRSGGVGTETQIITSEIYNKVKQEKFIPVVAEVGEEFDSYVPIFLKNRIGIDLSSIEVFEDGYDKLLRTITDKPLYRRPVRGELPSYLFEDEKSHFKTNSLVKQINNCIFKNSKQAKYFINDFLKEFRSALIEFQIEPNDFIEPYDEMILKNIDDMTNLRNDYVGFLQLSCNDNTVFDIDIIINLFEDIYLYSEYQGNNTYNGMIADHFKFFITELFLYTIVILVENKMFKEVNILLSTKYFLKEKFNNVSEAVFERFRFYIPSLEEYRKSRLKLDRVSIVADLIVQRSIINKKNFKEDLLVADLLLHFISGFKSNENYSRWFPVTYIYRENSRMELFKRLVSKRHFERVKVLFDVDTKEEMKLLIEKDAGIEKAGYPNSFSRIPEFQNFIKSQDICTSI